MDIVIDFDGTVVSHEFPKVSKDIGAEHVLHELIANGHNLILFTMRSDMDKKIVDGLKHHGIVDVQGNHLTEAVNWFKERNIPLYGIQTNPTQFAWTSSPKAYGALIIDDAALGCPLVSIGVERPYVDWIEVRRLLVKMGVIIMPF
jgi:hypothetical protein